MTGDGVSTHLQKEVSGLQQKVSKLQEDFVRLEAKVETRLQEFKEEFRGDLQMLLSRYFGPPRMGLQLKGSRIREKAVHQRNQSYVGDASIKSSRLECPRFDGSDFRGWWTKLDQYFEAESTPECDKIRVVMLYLDGRALEWHQLYSQRNGGLRMLSWPVYMKSMQDRFGFGQFGNPMKELVNLKQQGIVEQYQDLFVGLLNQLHLPESYALSIFLSNLRTDIGLYLDLFEPSTLMEATS
ncbi:hypothetical protein CXB51_010861 [Gossypium anomalum]|uniref:Retrotransposon gag domain-containing protein n=1 Tax=Gossypium anomalum TaxID=47600 RepID=A0A8J5YN74_9ROSI|nr:hypothetical protein CXB51_010861 [Gossypium anomalum]